MSYRFSALCLLLTPVMAVAEGSVVSSHPPADDLSELLSAPVSAKLKLIQLESLTPAANASILAKPELSYGDPRLVAIGDNTDNPRSGAEAKQVKRSGQVLRIQPKQGPALTFRNWSSAAADGDSESYVYDGQLAQSGYLKVDIFYGHDAPGSFFIQPNTGKVFSAHSGMDLTALAPNQQQLLVLNDGLNPPLGLLLVQLNQSGHKLSLQCQGRDFRTSPKISPLFKGWYPSPEQAFALVLQLQAPDQSLQAYPMHFSYRHAQWHVAVSQPELFTQATGVQCWQSDSIETKRP